MMMKSDYDDAKAVARLPNLDIEILHRRAWDGADEMLSITLRATPSFGAFFRFFETAYPVNLWMRTMEAAWSPWLNPSNANKSSNANERLTAKRD
jgi:hypothetical protein